MNQPNRHLQALVGYLVDLYKIANFSFINPHSYTKFLQIKSAAKLTESKIFIETGTYLGVTAKRCSRIFKNVYTVELDEKLADKATKFLAPQKNIEVIQGDGAEVLPQILQRPEVDECLVFLDGHFSGGITACGIQPEPAVEEIKILGEYRNKIKGIIIDDFRLFGYAAGFPSKSEIVKTIEDYFPKSSISIHLDQVIVNNSER